VLLGQFDELLMVYTSRSNENHSIRGVVGFDVVVEVIALDGEDVIPRAEDGAS
jgi:hypothetical protein